LDVVAGCERFPELGKLAEKAGLFVLEHFPDVVGAIRLDAPEPGALHAAAGRSVLGAPPARPRNVLYLDYEMTTGDLHERLDDFGYSDAVDLGHFHYALLPSLPPLNTWEGCRDLCQLAADVNAEAVVIDTMGRAVQGEENSADSYREFARTTGLALKAAGRSVLRTDHAGKDRDKGQRGSSAKNDDVDVVFRIDATQGGWLLTRTHSRVAWVPDKVAIERLDGDHLELVARRGDRVYAVGTKELADRLRELGVDATWTKKAAGDALKAADGKAARGARMSDAMAWIRAESAPFQGLAEGGNGAGNAPGTASPGTAREQIESDEQTPWSDDRERSGNARERYPEPTREHSPPLKGDCSEGRSHDTTTNPERLPLL
jgi:hypothetical protein